MHDDRSDAELLRAVRDGDGGAWERLWHRHYDAALRYARRLYWSRAEDLVSESFLAIYQQLRTKGNGPESSFRAYLKTVIRNTSARWHADAGRVLDAEDVDQVDTRDGLRHVERESGSAEVLAAFGSLPDRWQRVLWLSEVDQAARPVIARELGIKPNAVSALQRRARAGMRYQWLLRQVPTGLRGDAAHVARLLPQHVAHPRNAALAAEVAAHLVTCMLCADLLRGMHASVARAQGGALSAVLLGAVGAGVPISASLSAGSAAAATTTAGVGVLAWLFAGGVTAATVGGLVATTLLTAAPAVAPPADALRASPAPARATPSPSPGPSSSAEAAGIEAPAPVEAGADPAVDAAPDPVVETAPARAPIAAAPDPAPEPAPVTVPVAPVSGAEPAPAAEPAPVTVPDARISVTAPLQTGVPVVATVSVAGVFSSVDPSASASGAVSVASPLDAVAAGTFAVQAQSVVQAESVVQVGSAVQAGLTAPAGPAMASAGVAGVPAVTAVAGVVVQSGSDCAVSATSNISVPGLSVDLHVVIPDR